MNLIALILMIIMVVLAVSSAAAEATTGRAIVGSVKFPAPPGWGAELELWIDFDLQEVSARSHSAMGEITWRILDKEKDAWRVVKSHPSCVLFGKDVGEDPATAIVVTRIQQVDGWGDGLPGEYAYWWVRDDGENDQFAILYYSNDPWYEFFPKGKPPACAYFEPRLKIDMGGGLEIIH